MVRKGWSTCLFSCPEHQQNQMLRSLINQKSWSLIYLKCSLWFRLHCVHKNSMGTFFGNLSIICRLYKKLQTWTGDVVILYDRGRPWSPRGEASARVVEKINEGKVPGVGKIHPEILPVSWLTHLFNVTWPYKIVSVEWHTVVVVVVVSIFKKGDQRVCSGVLHRSAPE